MSIAIIAAGSKTDLEARPVVDIGLKIPEKGAIKIPETEYKKEVKPLRGLAPSNIKINLSPSIISSKPSI